MIVLVGFMGAGKTTVGRLLATKLGVPFVDTDAVIEARAGMPVARIFEERDEGAFRSLETDVVQEVLTSGEGVVALGAGALADPVNRTTLQWAKAVVHLDVSFPEVLKRIGGDQSRPMLALRDPKALFLERQDLYRSAATATVTTDGRTPEQVMTAIAEELGLWEQEASPDFDRILVATPSRGYEVVVGSGTAALVDELLPDDLDAEQAFIVTHPSLEHLSGTVRRALGRRDLDVQVVTVPEGETSKSLEIAWSVYDRLAEHSAHRNDIVVSFGGGVICDLAGFVASTYNRGMPVVHVPTSLLAQVDAAIGGKTAVNLAYGKNLVGTIHQPRVVVCDILLLATLPEPELRSGLAEVIKCAFVAEPDLLELIGSHGEELLERDRNLLRVVVARAAAIKASIVSADERDEGMRAYLNYGHTFAHAIEQLHGFTGIRHGEAVALGMMAAAYLASELGRIDPDVVKLHKRVLEAVGLPVSATLDLVALEEAWKRDKKYRGGVRFVLLSGLGSPEAGIEVPRKALVRAVERMGR